MTFIKSESALRTFFPNAFDSVEGEIPLYDKVMPFLVLAEHWMKKDILGEETALAIAEEDSEANLLCCQVIVSEAFVRAIPSLDLVLTPNGFGIVSNSNVAPASKERVERLLMQLKDNRDTYLQTLLDVLPLRMEWQGTEQQRFFAATLFPNLDIVEHVGRKEGVPVFPQYLALRYELMEAEHSLAEEYFSEELMADLRMKAHLNGLSAAYDTILSVIKGQLIRMLRKEAVMQRQMVDLVNFIRKNPAEFPLWHASATARLYEPHAFRNVKEDKAYWL